MFSAIYHKRIFLIRRDHEGMRILLISPLNSWNISIEGDHNPCDYSSTRVGAAY